MTNAMQLFKFDDSNEVRGGLIDGEPVLVARDVAVSLGFKDPANAIKQHCKGVAIHHPLSTRGGTQNVRLIREPDVYRLVLRANTPAAERFQDWICEQVLPSLRRTGLFAMTGTISPEEAEIMALEYRLAAKRKMLEARELECRAKLVNRIEGAFPIVDWLNENIPGLTQKQLANESRAIKRAIVTQLRRPVGAAKRVGGGKVMAAMPSDIESAVELLKAHRKDLN